MSESDSTQKHIAQLFTKNELLIHRAGKIEEKYEKISAKIDKLYEKISNKADTIKEGLNSRIDEMDIAFRGNGRIGVFEQIRILSKLLKSVETQIKELSEGLARNSLNFGEELNHGLERIKKERRVEIEEVKSQQDKKIKWLAIALISVSVLLIGGNVFGFNLKNIKDFFSIDTKPEMKQVQPNTSK